MVLRWSLVVAGLSLCLGLAGAKLTENRKESKQLQKALGRDHVVIVIDGILERISGEPSPDPLALINFPDIDTQFKVHVLEEDNRKIKLTLAQQNGEFLQRDKYILNCDKRKKVSMCFERRKGLMEIISTDSIYPDRDKL